MTEPQTNSPSLGQDAFLSAVKSHVLLVDDDESVLLTLEAAFVAAGYDVTTTTEPRQVLELAARRRPDAMVLDIVMPEMSGWDLLAQIRQSAPLELVPVILLSSLEEAVHRIRGLRAGADDYVVKPFEPEEIVARVESRLKRPGHNGEGLWGRLDFQPVQELVQSLENNLKSGELHVETHAVSGTVVVGEGKVVKADWGGLHDVTAVQAILELKEGQFRFTPRRVEPGEGREGREPFSVLPLLMEQVWVLDELQARARYLPEDDALLCVTDARVRVPPGLARLPANRIYEHLSANPGTSLARLLQEWIDAPRAVRLAVAWLHELQAVQVLSDATPEGLLPAHRAASAA